MNIDFNKYLNIHGTGYVIKTAVYDGGTFHMGSYVLGNRQVLPEVLGMREDSLFDIASVTKFFTATLIHIAVQEGLLKLDSKVKEIDSRFLYLEDVTVLNLLTHTIELWTEGYLGSATSKEEFYTMLFHSKIKSRNPVYVDAHYMILSILLETVYQLPLSKILEEKIVKPLNLMSTSYEVKDKGNVVSNNYELLNGKIIDTIYPGVVHDTKARIADQLGIHVGHAGIFTTADDMFQFLMSFIDDEYKLLNQESIASMFRHDDIYEEQYKILSDYCKDNTIEVMDDRTNLNSMYRSILEKVQDQGELNTKIEHFYNCGGTIFQNDTIAGIDISSMTSKYTVMFNGYTGPIFLLDFEKKIIVLVMTNAVHNTKKTKPERYRLSKDLVNEIYNDLCSSI